MGALLGWYARWVDLPGKPTERHGSWFRSVLAADAVEAHAKGAAAARGATVVSAVVALDRWSVTEWRDGLERRSVDTARAEPVRGSHVDARRISRLARSTDPWTHLEVARAYDVFPLPARPAEGWVREGERIVHRELGVARVGTVRLWIADLEGGDAIAASSGGSIWRRASDPDERAEAAEALAARASDGSVERRIERAEQARERAWPLVEAARVVRDARGVGWLSPREQQLVDEATRIVQAELG